MAGELNPAAQAYRDGVLQTSGDMPVIFIDTNNFDGLNVDIPNNVTAETADITDEHVLQLRAQLNEGAPGLGNVFDDDSMRILTQLYVNDGPRALSVDHEGQRYCMVGDLHESIDQKDELIPLMAHEALENIQPIPGTEEEWQTLVGRHEGSHCDDPSEIEGEISLNSEDERVLHMLNTETEADRMALDVTDGSVSPEVLDAYKDYRGIVVGDQHDDFDHATGPFLDNPESSPLTQDHVEGARASVDAMISGVASELGISQDDALAMRSQDPEQFVSTLETLVQRGDFKDGQVNEHVNTFVEDYVDAYRDRVLETGNTPTYSDEEPDATTPTETAPNDGPVPYEFSSLQNGAPEIVAGETRDEMHIGGQSAASYFASVSDPALAEQRIAMMAEQGATMDASADQNAALDTMRL